MTRFLIFYFLVGNLFSPVNAASNSGGVQIVDPEVRYQFGQEIIFEATVVSDIPVEEVYLLFQPEGSETILGRVTLERGRARFVHNLPQQPIHPFSRVYYWFTLKLQNDEEVTSPSFWFDYEDNRFDWQFVENGVFQVRWYDGDLTFGQSILNIAHQGLDTSRELIPVSPPMPIKIYVYATQPDLQTAIQLAGQPWVAGYAQADQAAVIISAQPGSEAKLELERKIPHEITHILLAQLAGQSYSRIPTWLLEGLATLSELYSNPDYERALLTAKQENSLFSIETLCNPFPQDASTNFLAYAQSASFSRYINQQYGNHGIQLLLQNYRNGLGCDEGIRAAFDINLRQLENRWKTSSLGINATQQALNNLLPYFLLAGVILCMPLISVLHTHAKNTKS